MINSHTSHYIVAVKYSCGENGLPVLIESTKFNSSLIAHYFNSSVLSDLALDWKGGWGNLVLILTSLLFICRSCRSMLTSFHLHMKSSEVCLGGRGVLPYMGYTGTCRWIGYGFWPLCPEQVCNLKQFCPNQVLELS